MSYHFKKTARIDLRATRWEKALIRAGAAYNDRGGISSWIITLAVQESLRTLPLSMIEGTLAKYNLTPDMIKDMPPVFQPSD